jgi:hypothetical protein
VEEGAMVKRTMIALTLMREAVDVVECTPAQLRRTRTLSKSSYTTNLCLNLTFRY